MTLPTNAQWQSRCVREKLQIKQRREMKTDEKDPALLAYIKELKQAAKLERKMKILKEMQAAAQPPGLPTKQREQRPTKRRGKQTKRRVKP